MANLEKTPVQATQTGIPATYHDEQDGTYSLAIAARMRIWDGANWVRWDGAVTGGGGAGGSVTQGTSPWVVSGTVAVTGTFWQSTQPVSIASMPSTPVTGTFWQSTQPVSIASMPSTAVTGPLTDTQLRASAVPVSLASAPTTAVTQSTSPWVTNDPGLPDTLGQKAMSGSTGVTIASDQTSIPVAATLAAETTKVIGTVNQGTSPWVISGALTDTQIRATALPVSLAAETTKVIGAVNQGTSPWVVGSHAVTNAGTFAVQQTLPATGAVTSPASVTTSVATVLASNAARYMATVYNESGAICYLKLGAAASLTSYTLQVAIGGYYEVPGGYTGVLTGITSASTSVLRVTEITT